MLFRSVDFIYTQKESVTMQERSEGGLAMENNKYTKICL